VFLKEQNKTAAAAVVVVVVVVVVGNLLFIFSLHFMTTDFYNHSFIK